MTDVLKICGVLLAAALVTLFMPPEARRARYLVALAGTVAAAGFAVGGLGDSVKYIEELCAQSGADVPLRVLGIVCVGEIAALVCSDVGENGLAEGVRIVEHAQILILTLPVIKSLVAVCAGFIE